MIRIYRLYPGVVVHVCNLSTGEAKARFQVQHQPGQVSKTLKRKKRKKKKKAWRYSSVVETILNNPHAHTCAHIHTYKHTHTEYSVVTVALILQQTSNKIFHTYTLIETLVIPI